MRQILYSWLHFVVSTGVIILPGIYGEEHQDGASSNSSRVRLIDQITENYHKIIRPVLDTSTVTNVTLRVICHHLIDMDTKSQQFTLSIWVKQIWRDEFISWNPSHFDDIESIYVPSDILWKPDLTLYTNVDPDFGRYRSDPLSLIWHDGRVEWLHPGIVTNYCEVSVRHFPFDKQVCELIFGPWDYTNLQIKMNPEVGPTAIQDRYVNNGVWDLQSVTVRERSFYYSCCPDNFSQIVYKLTFRRHPEFYIIHLILPCVFLSSLALLVFYLPPDCGEKLTLAITNLLALVVFQQIIAEHTPPSGKDQPIIDTYFLFLIMLMCISVGCTVFVIHVSNKSHAVNPHILKITYLLESVLLMNSRSAWRQPKEKNNISFCHAYGTHVEDETDSSDHAQNITIQKGQEKTIYSAAEPKATLEDFSADWKRVALVLDRILLITLFVCALVTTSAFGIKLYVETKEFARGENDENATELMPSRRLDINLL